MSSPIVTISEYEGGFKVMIKHGGIEVMLDCYNDDDGTAIIDGIYDPYKTSQRIFFCADGLNAKKYEVI
jgi:hypothetical protein